VLAAVIQRVSMLNAETATALVTGHLQHLFLLAPLFRAPVHKNLLFLPRMVVTVSINVLTNHHIWYLSLFYWDRVVTKWAHWDLNILAVCKFFLNNASPNQGTPL